jgi:hypothetical protein
MSRRYIDFISAYCDSWCERCAFTERCSHFALTSAIAMCDGDVDAAMELAIGQARAPGRDRPTSIGERMADVLGDCEPSENELEAIGRELDERDRRIRRHSLAEKSLDYAVAAHRWLKSRDPGAGGADAAVLEAIEVIRWDAHLIHVKIMRALDGRDEYPKGAPYETSAVQSDWNGSAKVALISIDRSERGWRLVAATTGDEAAAVLAADLRTVRQEMGEAFPRAMEFRRPGFDSPE